MSRFNLSPGRYNMFLKSACDHRGMIIAYQMSAFHGQSTLKFTLMKL